MATPDARRDLAVIVFVLGIAAAMAGSEGATGKRRGVRA
jgi:hypothetical protein